MKQMMALIAIGLMMTNAHGADCEQAQNLMIKGIDRGKQDHWTQAQQWLKKSVDLCNRFENWYLLGQAEKQLKRDNAALIAFEEAKNYATNADERALAMARYAQVLALQNDNDIGRPLTLLHQARKLHSSPPAWIKQLAIKLDTKRVNSLITVAELTRALDNPAIRLFAPESKPQYDLAIHFKTNSVELLPESKPVINKIATALTGEVLKGKQFTLTGHADKRGAEQHNCELSVARAESIVIKLLEIQPALIGRLTVAGKGEYEPLYDGEGDDIFKLNRRVEIMVDAPPPKVCTEVAQYQTPPNS